MSGSNPTERPGFLWAAPALLFFGLFGLAPVLVVAYLSFTEWNGLGDPSWIGTANWETLALSLIHI